MPKVTADQTANNSQIVSNSPTPPDVVIESLELVQRKPKCVRAARIGATAEVNADIVLRIGDRRLEESQKLQSALDSFERISVQCRAPFYPDAAEPPRAVLSFGIVG